MELSTYTLAGVATPVCALQTSTGAIGARGICQTGDQRDVLPVGCHVKSSEVPFRAVGDGNGISLHNNRLYRSCTS
jgi:hypothetical protein